MSDVKKEVISTLYTICEYLRAVHHAGRTVKDKQQVKAYYRTLYPLLPVALWEYGDIFGGEFFVYMKFYINQQVNQGKLCLCSCRNCQNGSFADLLEFSDKSDFYSTCKKHITYNEVVESNQLLKAWEERNRAYEKAIC